MDDQQSPSQKQQITEVLRNATNLVITTNQNPDVDQIAAAIALAQIAAKVNKRGDAVVSSPIPGNIKFLPTKLLNPKFSGIRDFVISVDITKTEADKLKYVPEGGKLNIYVTPFKGNFSKEDVSFNYGDYHCDAVIALGVAKPTDLDKEVINQAHLLEKAKLITINAGNGEASSGSVAVLDWHEPTATSICEMLMSLTEALQSGLVDAPIATSLLSGIVAKTNSFTGTNTTPKVMTMAAQLMAAGANQADIMKHLHENAPSGSESILSPSSPTGIDTKTDPSKSQGITTKPAESAKPTEPGKLEASLEQSIRELSAPQPSGSTAPSKPEADSAKPNAPAPKSVAELPKPIEALAAPNSPSPTTASPLADKPKDIASTPPLPPSPSVSLPPLPKEMPKPEPTTLAPPSTVIAPQSSTALPPPVPAPSFSMPAPSSPLDSSSSNTPAPTPTFSPSPKPEAGGSKITLPVPDASTPKSAPAGPTQADLEAARKAVEEATRDAKSEPDKLKERFENPPITKPTMPPLPPTTPPSPPASPPAA